MKGREGEIHQNLMPQTSLLNVNAFQNINAYTLLAQIDERY